MANGYIKRCAALVIKKIQTQTKMKYHLEFTKVKLKHNMYWYNFQEKILL